MSHQAPLFYESIEDAIRDLVRVLGGAKTVGHLLWPGKSMQDAQTRLLNCLDHNRLEKLGPEDLLVLLRKGRDTGCHVVMEYINDSCGYAKPVPLDPANEQLKAIAAVESAAAELRRASEALERARADSAVLRVVK
jgi:hypothetical protein